MAVAAPSAAVAAASTGPSSASRRAPSVAASRSPSRARSWPIATATPRSRCDTSSCWPVRSSLPMRPPCRPRTAPAPSWTGSPTRRRRPTAGLVYDDPGFAGFFRRITPIELLSSMRLGSRPAARQARRAAGATEPVDDSIDRLRAIPWGFAWAQARIELPGWYGLGAAVEAVRDELGDERHGPAGRAVPGVAVPDGGRRSCRAGARPLGPRRRSSVRGPGRRARGRSPLGRDRGGARPERRGAPRHHGPGPPPRSVAGHRPRDQRSATRTSTRCPSSRSGSSRGFARCPADDPAAPMSSAWSG